MSDEETPTLVCENYENPNKQIIKFCEYNGHIPHSSISSRISTDRNYQLVLIKQNKDKIVIQFYQPSTSFIFNNKSLKL